MRRLASAVASTSTLEPAYRVDLQIGAHALVADEPATAGTGDLGPTPIAPLLSALTRHPARHTHHHDLPDRLRRDR